MPMPSVVVVWWVVTRLPLSKVSAKGAVVLAGVAFWFIRAGHSASIWAMIPKTFFPAGVRVLW